MSIRLWGNTFVAIDVETTGLDPDNCEITQLAAIVLTDDFKPREGVPYFNMQIRPRFPENIQSKALSKSHQTLENLMVNGLDYETAVHVWTDWISQTFKKKIIPVAFNWVFDREFIINFMGRQAYETVFHPVARDVMLMLVYINDRLETFEYTPGFTSFTLKRCCEVLKVHNERAHDALHDCLATAECAHRAMRIALP